jgi:effector-binding domain-containing protein
MIDPPEIARTEATETAVIHVTVPREQIQEVMGPGIGELMATVAAQGVALTGPWFSHHLREPSDTFDFEIGVPVASPVTPAGRVKPGRLRATRVARTIYRGDYSGLGEAWGELDAWIGANGHAPEGDLWECYLTDPGANPDPSTWQTELVRPLKG